MDGWKIMVLHSARLDARRNNIIVFWVRLHAEYLHCGSNKNQAIQVSVRTGIVHTETKMMGLLWSV